VVSLVLYKSSAREPPPNDNEALKKEDLDWNSAGDPQNTGTSNGSLVWVAQSHIFLHKIKPDCTLRSDMYVQQLKQKENNTIKQLPFRSVNSRPVIETPKFGE